MSTARRLTTIDTLRGLASLGVCWYHMTSVLNDFPVGRALREAGSYGRLGVQIFFVISGFIIPHSLRAANYLLSDYGRFVLRRAIRIDLPCYASLALIVALGLLGQPLPFETAPQRITALQVLLHLGYLNYIAGDEFLNGVLWSIAIEFQYYLLIGLLFPLLSSPKLGFRLYVFALLGGLAFLAPAPQLVFHYAFLFLLGIHTFHYCNGLIGRRAYALGLPLLCCGAALTLGPLPTIAGTATALTIALWGERVEALRFFGRISYSLYLVHMPVGIRVLRAGQPLVTGPVTQMLLLCAGVLGSVAAAWVLYVLVEQPAQRWASAVRYRRPG